MPQVEDSSTGQMILRRTRRQLPLRLRSFGPKLRPLAASHRNDNIPNKSGMQGQVSTAVEAEKRRSRTPRQTDRHRQTETHTCIHTGTQTQRKRSQSAAVAHL